MEFYIKILDLFYKSGDSVFELFAGMKLLVANIVSIASAHSLAWLKLNSLFMKSKFRLFTLTRAKPYACLALEFSSN